ncbi:MAG: FKBP-type peptidyl-prolyl cis-trans isomerase [Planctomycetes bacterium]|nr:FKBP-type peptidyl-prolyl cis-trans isomerase [Planctomycetota bacterium]
MADAGKPQAEGLDKAKMKQYLVPALAVAGVVVLAALVMFVSGGVRKMSDGSNGSADDPDLKEAAPGVKYRDIKEGIGDPCPPGAEVQMHYTGWREDGEVFGSTREGARATGQPATFKLKGLIKGWQEGIPGMKKGGIRKLVIAPEKGYGKDGSPPKIPPNSTLIFEVELVDFTPPRNVTTGPGRPMPFDGSNGGTDDPGLKDIGEGLKIRDLKEGSGDPVAPGATVTIHYTGWTVDGNVFDDSRPRGAPNTWSLGELVPGWQKGIPGMKPGGVRKLVVPSTLGYGEGGKGEKIPGGATLVFEVELIK